MKIENLLETIGFAIQEAYRAIEYNSVNQFFENYFDRVEKAEGDITYTPKIIEVEIPTANSDKKSKILYTPIAALAQHKNLNLDNVTLNLNIDISEDSEVNLKSSPKGTHPPQDNSELKQAGTLELTFKRSDTAEGIARIETRLHNLL